MIKSTEYMPPSERNMNGHYNHNLSHQKQGRNHDIEWESILSTKQTTAATTTATAAAGAGVAGVNGGRVKSRITPAVLPSSVTTITQYVTDGKRDRQERSRNTRHHQSTNNEQQHHHHQSHQTVTTTTTNKQIYIETKYTKTTNVKSMETNERLLNRTNLIIPTTTNCGKNHNSSNNHQQQRNNKNNTYQHNKRAIASSSVSAPASSSITKNCYVGGAVNLADSATNSNCNSSNSVFGVYSETKYTFSVNGLPGNPAQASAAAAFFAR